MLLGCFNIYNEFQTKIKIIVMSFNKDIKLNSNPWCNEGREAEFSDWGGCHHLYWVLLVLFMCCRYHPSLFHKNTLNLFNSLHCINSVNIANIVYTDLVSEPSIILTGLCLTLFRQTERDNYSYVDTVKRDFSYLYMRNCRCHSGAHKNNNKHHRLYKYILETFSLKMKRWNPNCNTLYINVNIQKSFLTDSVHDVVVSTWASVIRKLVLVPMTRWTLPYWRSMKAVCC